MNAIKPSIKSILCVEKIAMVLEKLCEMEASVMGHYVYKEMGTLFVGKKLDTTIQPNNVKDK